MYGRVEVANCLWGLNRTGIWFKDYKRFGPRIRSKEVELFTVNVGRSMTSVFRNLNRSQREKESVWCKFGSHFKTNEVQL